MYSSRTGQCQFYNGKTNIATPYVRRSCFESSFLTPMEDRDSDEPQTFYNAQRNIKNNDSTCGYDFALIENPMNPDKFSSFDGRNSLWRRENSVIVGYAPRDYKTPNGETCPQQPYIVVDETNQRKVVCPVTTSYNVQPQCATCTNVVFSCDRYKELDPVAYGKCREYQRMIHYNIVAPGGTMIPMAYEMTDEGVETFKTVIQKCGFQCYDPKVNYPSWNYSDSPCKGPPYTSTSAPTTTLYSQ